MAVMAPDKSTRIKQESIHVVVWFLGLNSGSKEELPPDGSKQVEMPMPASNPCDRNASLSLTNSSREAVFKALVMTVS